MTTEIQTVVPTAQPRIQVPLCDLGLAPENLRAAEPEDAGVPRLADTIRAAGVIYPPIVRKGRKGEAPFMVLDGRRRRFALQHLAAEGVIPADHPVECLLAEDRAAQTAAAVLPNAEHAPIHLADVILAIGKLRRSRLTTTGIAEALGYDEIEVRRLEAMAHVHPDVLQAFREGRLNLRQVRLFARVRDRARQGELAQEALRGYVHEHTLRTLATGDRATAEDPRFALVTEAAYAAAGGRLKSDLFGELPAEVLDPPILDTCWRTAAAEMAAPLAAEGIALSFARERGFAAPDGLEHLPFVHWGTLPDERRTAFEAGRARIEAALTALEVVDEAARDGAIAELLLARLALARLTAGRGEVAAALLTPVRSGIDITFYNRPAPQPEPAERDDDDRRAAEEEDDDGNDEAGLGGCASRRGDIAVPAVVLELSGVTHLQHAARTEVATRGLMRDLADHPDAAIVVLTAHLFCELALSDVRGADESVLRTRATGSVRGDGPDDPLAGSVWGRLESWRGAYLESGARPIPFVAGLDAHRRRQLLVELTAATVDAREARTDSPRRAARAEAEEIAALCSADLSRHWTPDAAFVALHSRAQLMAFLAQMAVEVPKAAAVKKDELVQAVTEAAAARRWLPSCLRWGPTPADASIEAETAPDASVDADPSEPGSDEPQAQAA